MYIDRNAQGRWIYLIYFIIYKLLNKCFWKLRSQNNDTFFSRHEASFLKVGVGVGEDSSTKSWQANKRHKNLNLWGWGMGYFFTLYFRFLFHFFYMLPKTVGGGNFMIMYFLYVNPRNIIAARKCGGRGFNPL